MSALKKWILKEKENSLLEKYKHLLISIGKDDELSESKANERSQKQTID